MTKAEVKEITREHERQLRVLMDDFNDMIAGRDALIVSWAAFSLLRAALAKMDPATQKS